ncbi:MAG: AAA family ATPase [Elusimicrobia bacterium]|nr:AAA family ATPase [Elusimicrobiota bacterium]
MYQKHWDFKKLPFENTPDTDFFFQSERHAETLSRLAYIVGEKKSCGVLTGVYGTGKTLMLKALERDFKKKGFVFSLVVNPRLDDVGILKMILHDFTGYGVPKEKEDVLMALEKFIRETHQDGKHNVIMIDEAHSVDNSAVFEELRLLMNFQTETRFLLTLIISGQPELLEKISSNKQFGQRIVLNCELLPLDFKETKDYIAHRLKTAGCQEQVFTEEALDLIYQRSAGIPRWINNISNMSLLAGYSKDEKTVDADLVQEAIESIK